MGPRRALSRTMVVGAVLVLGCGADVPEADLQGTDGASSSMTEATDGVDDTGSGSTSGAATSSSGDESTSEAPPAIVPGLRGEYFASYHDPVLVRVDPSLEFVWEHDAPAEDVGSDRFSIRWSGWLTPPHSGAYTIITESDDGVRVWIDDELVLDAWTPQYVTRNEAQVELVGGVPVPLR